MFGVKSTGEEFDIKKFGCGKHATKYDRNLQPNCKYLPNFKDNLVLSHNLRKKTCKVYMYAVLDCLLATHTSIDIDLSYKDLVEDVDNIKKWNLTDLIVKLLVQSIKDIKDKKATYLVGSPFLLIVSNLETSK